MAPAKLIGRTAEIDALTRIIGADPPAGAGSPTAGAVLLGGDAGVGKTRLLAELAQRAAGAGQRVVAGHCVDLGESPVPYLPFSQILARVSAEEPAEASALVQLRPALRRLMPALGPARADGRGDRAELFEAVAAGLAHLAESRPTLAIVEDVHWADKSTRELLTYLLAHLPDRPLSLVLSYRSDDLHRRHPLRSALGEWSRLPGVERIPVPPLADREVRQLVRALDPSPMPRADVAAIVARAEGNPFFVEELVGASRDGNGALPTDLSDLLLVRVDALPEAVRSVVRAASVAGRAVSHVALVHVVGGREDDLEARLREAVDANVLRPAGPDGYSFRHALLAEAVYQDLLPGERVRLHAAFARSLENHPELGTAADLAYHARGSHDRTTALRASVRAGDEAMALAAPDAALAQYEAALQLLGAAGAAHPPGPEAGLVDPVELTLRASRAAVAAGHPFRALALVRDQVAGSSPGVTPEGRARLLRGLAAVALLVDSAVDVLAVTTEALSLVPPEPPTALRAELMSLHARAHLDRHRIEDAVRWATEALEAARRLQLAEVSAEAATTLARLQQDAVDLEQLEGSLEQAAAGARAAGETGAELRALYNLGVIYFERGRLPDALRIFRAALERAEETGRPWAPYGVDARALAAIVCYVLGFWTESDDLTATAGESPPELADALLTAVRTSVQAGRGEAFPEATAAYLDTWSERDGLIAILTAAARIDLLGDRGDVTAAIATHDQVVAHVSNLWHLPTFAARLRLAALVIGQMATAMRRTAGPERESMVATARKLAAGAEEVVGSIGARSEQFGPEGRAWRKRAEAETARLAWAAGTGPDDPTELIRLWAAAVEAFAGLGHRFETARSQARLAAALRTAGRSAEADALVASARATAEQLGARPLLTELADLQPARPGPAGAADSLALTSREHEVLVLVALGRSNREIAQQLYISPKTASVHVSNILAKLQAQSRTEAVAIARQLGLLAVHLP